MGDVDKCPQCGMTANRVWGKGSPFDFLGTEDEYVCDYCNLSWPTEWNLKNKQTN